MTRKQSFPSNSGVSQAFDLEQCQCSSVTFNSALRDGRTSEGGGVMIAPAVRFA